jgi:hypothetical protein
MRDRDELGRRLLDGELEGEQRAELERRRGADPALDGELHALARIQRELPALRARPRADFADRVMAAIAAAPARRETKRVLRQPIGMILMVGACFALAIGASWIPAHLGVSPRRPAPTHSAAAPATVAVRFALEAPQARTVAVAGEWSGWRAQPLDRAPGGGWSGVIPLGHGEWRYQFLVDGAWVEDPAAAAYRADGFGGKNALLRL